MIRVGAVPTSKPLQQFLQARPDRAQVVIDAGTPRDPSHLATRYINADAATTFAKLADRVANLSRSADRQWLDVWRAVDQTTGAAIESALAHEECPFEGRAVAEVAALFPKVQPLSSATACRSATSMPHSSPRGSATAADREQSRRKRDRWHRLDRTWRRRYRGWPLVLIVGDLSFFHDLNGLLAAANSSWTPLLSSSTTTAAASFRFFLRPSSLTRRRSKPSSGRRRGLILARQPGSLARRTLDPGLGTHSCMRSFTRCGAMVCRSSTRDRSQRQRGAASDCLGRGRRGAAARRPGWYMR